MLIAFGELTLHAASKLKEVIIEVMSKIGREDYVTRISC